MNNKNNEISISGNNYFLLKNAGYIAITAALLGAISDVLLLYTPNGGFLNPDFQFLKHISYSRLLSGALLGVFCIPFEILGSWQIYSVAKKENPKMAMLTIMAAVYFACIGVTVHMLYGVIGVGMQMHTHLSSEYTMLINDHFKQLESFMKPVATVVILLHVISTLLFVLLIRKTKNIFPAWLTYVNPVTIYIILASPYIWWPTLGNVLAPAAFNLSYGIFFCITTYYINLCKGDN